MAKLVYPGLSYEIVGILFTVYNNLKFGYQEKYKKIGGYTPLFSSLAAKVTSDIITSVAPVNITP